MKHTTNNRHYTCTVYTVWWHSNGNYSDEKHCGKENRGLLQLLVNIAMQVYYTNTTSYLWPNSITNEVHGTFCDHSEWV